MQLGVKAGDAARAAESVQASHVAHDHPLARRGSEAGREFDPKDGEVDDSYCSAHAAPIATP